MSGTITWSWTKTTDNYSPRTTCLDSKICFLFRLFPVSLFSLSQAFFDPRYLKSKTLSSHVDIQIIPMTYFCSFDAIDNNNNKNQRTCKTTSTTTTWWTSKILLNLIPNLLKTKKRVTSRHSYDNKTWLFFEKIVTMYLVTAWNTGCDKILW